MKKLFPITAALVCCGLVTQAQDWPQWGGNDPGRNMYSPAKNMPTSFDPGKLKSGTEDIDLATTKNVRWVAKLGSQSYGNPVVANGKVYVGTNNETPRNKQHQGDRSILMCFDEKTGELLWQLVVPKLASGKVNDWENLGLLLLSDRRRQPRLHRDQPLRSHVSRCRRLEERQRRRLQGRSPIHRGPRQSRRRS